MVPDDLASSIGMLSSASISKNVLRLCEYECRPGNDNLMVNLKYVPFSMYKNPEATADRRLGDNKKSSRCVGSSASPPFAHVILATPLVSNLSIAASIITSRYTVLSVSLWYVVFTGSSGQC